MQMGISCFTVLGYGHGVGMSQYGSELYGKAGQQILRRYSHIIIRIVRSKGCKACAATYNRSRKCVFLKKTY